MRMRSLALVLVAGIAQTGMPASAQTDMTLNAPASAAPNSAPVSAGPGALLALDGRWSAKLPACVACHGPGGMGVGTSFPPLAGQPAPYLAAQLEAWQQSKRQPGPLGLMQAVARRLSPSDIVAVSRWFAAQPAGGGG